MISGRTFSLRDDLVEARLLDVQELAAERQDRLEPPVAALLGRAAGRVALDDVELAAGGIALLAVGQLAGQRQPVERALAEDEVAGLARGVAGAGGRQALLDDPAAVAGVLVEVLAERLARRAVWTWPLTSALPSLAFVWPSNWGSVELDADDRGQALADVVARQVGVVVLEDARRGGPSRSASSSARPGSR